MSTKSNDNISSEERIKMLEEANLKLQSELVLQKTFSNNKIVAKLIESKIGFWTYTISTKQIALTENLLDIFNLSKHSAQIYYSDLIQYVIPTDIVKIDRCLKSAQSQNKKGTVTFQIENDGIRLLNLKIDKITDETISGIIFDITDEFYPYVNENESNSIYKNSFDQFTDIFIILESVYDLNGEIIDFIFVNTNPCFEMKFGISSSTIINQSFKKNFSILYQLFYQRLKITALTEQAQQDRVYIQSLDSFYDILIYTPSENKIAVILRDVSIMVERDNSLRESEEKYRQIFSIGSDALFMVDSVNDTILEVNPTGCRMLNMNRETLLKKKFNTFSTDPIALKLTIQNQTTYFTDKLIVENSNAIIPIEASVSYFNWAGRKVFVASIRDISERLFAQEKLIKSEQKFKQLFEYSNDAVIIMSNFKIIEFNYMSLDLFQIQIHEFINETFWNLSPQTQPDGIDSRMSAIDKIQNALLGNNLQFEWVFKRNNDSTFYANVKIAAIQYSNEKVLQIIIRDITKQKEDEKALITSEQRWKFALEGNSNGVWDWNTNTNEVYFSPVWKNILGYNEDEIENKFDEFTKRIHPEEVNFVFNSINQYLTSQIPTFLIDFRMHCKNGTFKWIRCRGKILTFANDGKPERFIGTNEDITRQVNYEKDILRREELYKNAVQIAKVGYWELDLRSLQITGTDETFNLFGIGHSEKISLKMIEKSIHPQDQKLFMNQFTNIDTSTEYTETTFRIIENGATKYVVSYSSPVTNSDNVLIGAKGIFQNVTSFKKQEKILADSEFFFKSIVENAASPTLLIQDSKIIYINPKFESYIGYASKDLLNETFKLEKIISKDNQELFIEKISDWSNRKVSKETIEMQIQTKRNQLKWAELNISTFELKDRLAVIITINDIDKLKESIIMISENESKYRKIFENAPTSLVITNTQGDIKDANSIFMKSSGYSESDFSKTNLLKILLNPYENLQNITINSTNKLNNKYLETENKLIIKNGQQQWNVLKTAKIDVNSAKNDLMITSLENIDNLKRKNQYLQETIDQLNAIFSTIPEGIVLFNSDESILYSNKNIFDIIEQEKHDESITHSPQLFRNFNSFNFAAIISELKTKDYYIQTLTSNNNNKIISLYAAQISYSNISKPLFIFIVKDVTIQKNYEYELTENEKTFHKIFDFSPLGIAIINKSRHITLFNNKFASTFGYTNNELLNKKIDDFTHPNYLEENIIKYTRLFTGVIDSFKKRVQYINKDGQIIWISSTISPLKNSFGDVDAAIAVIENIDQTIEFELNNTSNESINTITNITESILPYYINQLTLIKGEAFKLEKEFKKHESIRSIMNITSNKERIEPLLIPFRKKSCVIHSEVDLIQLINEVIINIKNSNNNISISLKQNPNIEQIITDKYKLTNALLKIIENAIESKPKTNEILISVDFKYFKSTLSNNARLSNRNIAISITDTGIGMDTFALQNCFKPFYTNKKSNKNIGMGLTIARKMISDIDGNIELKSEYNEGTSVVITFPEINKSITTNPTEIINQNGFFKFFLVEKDDIIRKINIELINKLGFDAIGIPNHQDAWEVFSTDPDSFDFVIIDSECNQLYQVEKLKKIKRLNPQCQFVLLQDNTDETDKVEYKEVGFFAVIQKPLNTSQILNLVNSSFLNEIYNK